MTIYLIDQHFYYFFDTFVPITHANRQYLIQLVVQIDSYCLKMYLQMNQFFNLVLLLQLLNLYYIPRMALSSFYFKKTQKQWAGGRKDFSHQGRCLSNKSKLNIILTTQPNQPLNIKNSYSSIFNNLSLKDLYPESKSQRKYFHSMSQLKNYRKDQQNNSNSKQYKKSNSKIYLSNNFNQNKINTQRLLNSSISRRIQTSNSELSKLKTSRIRTQTNQQILEQYNKIQNSKKQYERNALESTNVTIRSYSYMRVNKSEIEEKSSYKKSYNRKTEKEIKRIIVESLNKDKLNNAQSQVLKSQIQEEDMQIRLSLKSMAKSQEGQKSIEKKCPQKQKQGLPINIVNIKQKGQQLKSFKQKGQIFTSRIYQNNRMLIKFDKRIMLNSSQINDPCLKIQKIKAINPPN